MSRKKATDIIVGMIEDIEDGTVNSTLTRKYLNGLSEPEFKRLMQSYRDNDDHPSMVVPNGGDIKITVERNIKIAKKWKYEMFERLRLTDPITGETYLTPHRYLMLYLPVRRQSQLLEKKKATPISTVNVDEMTGQVTGKSKGATLTFVEIQALRAHGVDALLTELMSTRGGDRVALRAARKSIHETGQVSQEAMDALGTKTTVSKTVSALLKGMHLNNNF